MGKKRQKKSGSKKQRDKSRSRAGSAADGGAGSDAPYEPDGVMSGMVGGFRRAVGAQSSGVAKRGWTDGALLWLLFIVVIAVVAWRYM